MKYNVFTGLLRRHIICVHVLLSVNILNILNNIRGYPHQFQAAAVVTAAAAAAATTTAAAAVTTI